jgi:hypothetical protein
MNKESLMQHDGQMVIGLFVSTFVHVDLCKKIDSFPILLLQKKLINSFNKFWYVSSVFLLQICEVGGLAIIHKRT